MPTNANTFNSRVTSEALEKKFRDVFPAQGGAELVQDLFASGVIQPVIDFSSVAEGSVLAENLQTAFDFATSHTTTQAGTTTIANTPGFWVLEINVTMDATGSNNSPHLSLSDGISSKVIWQIRSISSGTASAAAVTNDRIVVFLRSGDTLSATSNNTSNRIDVSTRQIADVSGNLVNPLGFVSS